MLGVYVLLLIFTKPSLHYLQCLTQQRSIFSSLRPSHASCFTPDYKKVLPKSKWLLNLITYRISSALAFEAVDRPMRPTKSPHSYPSTHVFSNINYLKPLKSGLTSAPLSPTNLAIGPIYQTCAMHKIAPAHPTRNATKAAIPTGSFPCSFQAAQS